MTFTPNIETRPGRMFAALLSSDNKKGKMELTVTITSADKDVPLYRAFSIKKWTPRDSETSFLFVAVPDTADWDAGVKPLTPLKINLATGEVKVDTYDKRNNPLITYAAKAALQYAETGEAPKPANGTVEVVESTLCGHCGLTLRDPISIERGVGPTCFGKETGSKTIKLGKKVTA